MTEGTNMQVSSNSMRLPPEKTRGCRKELWRASMLARGALCLRTPSCDGNSSSREPKAAAKVRLWGIVCAAPDVPWGSTSLSHRPAAPPVPQHLPCLRSARPHDLLPLTPPRPEHRASLGISRPQHRPTLSSTCSWAPPAPPAVPVPAVAPPPPLPGWLRRRFRPWGPVEMAAATTAFSSASSSSAALLRPGWAPLRRWRALTRNTSSSPRSAARYLAPVASFHSPPSSSSSSSSSHPSWCGGSEGREMPEGSAGSGPPPSPFEADALGSPLSSAILFGETGKNQQEGGRRAGRGPGLGDPSGV